MKLKDFIEEFSHTNEIYVQNKSRRMMAYRYRKGTEYRYDVIMDWELCYTDIAECKVLKIGLVSGHKSGIIIRIQTSKEKFDFVPKLVKEDNCPVWLYEEVHNVKLQVAAVL